MMTHAGMCMRQVDGIARIAGHLEDEAAGKISTVPGVPER